MRHVVNAAERRHELGAILGLQNGPARPLRSRRPVVVHSDDQTIRLGGSRLEIAEMSGVQQVEAAICEGERQARSAVGAHAIDEIRACEDMSHCVDLDDSAGPVSSGATISDHWSARPGAARRLKPSPCRAS